jgi:hypothetical protein
MPTAPFLFVYPYVSIIQHHMHSFLVPGTLFFHFRGSEAQLARPITTVSSPLFLPASANSKAHPSGPPGTSVPIPSFFYFLFRTLDGAFGDPHCIHAVREYIQHYGIGHQRQPSLKQSEITY